MEIQSINYLWREDKRWEVEREGEGMAIKGEEMKGEGRELRTAGVSWCTECWLV